LTYVFFDELTVFAQLVL